MVRFQQILRRLAIIDEGVLQDQAGLGFGQAEAWVLDPKTAELVRARGLDQAGAVG